MNIGMLWFDNDPKAEITAKIERAATYYRNKYGKAPNLCFVHPSMVQTEPEKAADSPAEARSPYPTKNGAIEVRTSRSVLPNHFWIGVNAPPASMDS
jgi:hypothetical protein